MEENESIENAMAKALALIKAEAGDPKDMYIIGWGQVLSDGCLTAQGYAWLRSLKRD